MKPDEVDVRVRALLVERLEVIAEAEQMALKEIVDHALRSYVEHWEEDGWDGEDEEGDSEDE